MRISVDGNIASGKSSVLASIEDFFPTIPVRFEPVGEWDELLKLYHGDPETWALALNLKVLLSFHGLDAQRNLFVERSPMSCRHVFAQLELDDSRFDKYQFGVFQEYVDVIGWFPDAIVFIDVPAATCLERLEKRGRTCENGVDLEYLRRVEYQYQSMLRLCRAHDIPVMIVDGRQPEEKVKADVIAAVLRLVTSSPPSVQKSSPEV